MCMLLFSQAGASQFTHSLSFGGSQSQRSGVGKGGEVMATQQARNKLFFFRAATLREVQTPWQACAIFIRIVGVSACLVEEVGVCRDIHFIFVGIFSLFSSLSYVICMKTALYVI